MKQTKFRGKDVETGEWRYGDLITNNGKPFIVNNVIEANSEYISLEDWSPVIPETVDQSISLQDKNGIDIYAGDAVKYKESIGVVYYEDSLSMFMIEFPVGKSSWSFDSIEESVEVTGNVHDNSEIIK